MSSELQFNSTVLEVINTLTKINQSVIIWRDEKDIRISMADGDRLIIYVMHVPHEYFDIDESIAFYNFSEFYQFYKSISDASLVVGEETILVGGSDSKLKYFLSPVEKINIASDDKPMSPKNISFSGHGYEFAMTKKNLMELKKTSAMLGVTNLNFSKTPGQSNVIIKAYNDSNDIDFEKCLPINQVTDKDDGFSFDIIADHIDRLPTVYDYTVSIKTNGGIKFTAIMSDENITLDIITARRR
jgi:hypothetical protein